MTGRQTRSVETEAAFRQCAAAGYTQTETAIHLGVSFSTVSKHARQYGISFQSCTAKTEAEVRRCVELGYSCKETVACLGISTTTVWQTASRLGIRFVKKPRHDDAIKALAAEGKTRKEIASDLGICPGTVSQRVRALGLDVERHKMERPSGSLERAAAMAAMYKAGRTLNEIGDLYGVSRERVRQIISREHGLVGADGGQAVKAEASRRERATQKDQEYMARLGCDFADYRRIRDLGRALVKEGGSIHRTPLRSFLSQKGNARNRGIAWDIKFWDWWRIWQESGHWSERGRSDGNYVMCRFGDVGIYEVGNVYIATVNHNVSFQPNNPYRKGHPDHARVMLAASKKRDNTFRRRATGPNSNRKYTDLPLGVTRHSKTGRFQAQIGIDGKHIYLGTFSTADDAHAAYLRARDERRRPFQEAAE